jgi:hypothetical protein
LQLPGERSVGERGGEVLQALALDGRARTVRSGAYIALSPGERSPDRFCCLLDEAVRLALAGVDGDRDLRKRLSAGDSAAGVGAAGRGSFVPLDKVQRAATN